MVVTTNSKPSPVFELLVPLVLLALLSTAAVAWFHQRGYTLYYGDAEAHLNMARRVLDSRAPGLFQLGAVWLPLPHVLMLPFVANDQLWQSGLAGAIPVAFSFIVAAMFLFRAAQRIYGDRAAAAAVLCLFALNPNLLYLQSAPMTEPVFFATLCALLYFAVRHRESQSLGWVAAAGIAAFAATMTRYEGWFLVPFATLYFLIAARRRRLAAVLLFGAIASVGPLAWLAHNWWYLGDPWWFYRGPYSAMAIYKKGLALGYDRYRGDHDWGYAWLYYRNAVRVTAGWPVLLLGVAGAVAARMRRTFWPLLLLAPAPAFYLWSIYSGGTPIYMPHMWPFSYYNTRYGLEALPLLALAAGALVTLAPVRWRAAAALLVVGLGVAPWLWTPAPQGWICWKESQVNSDVRRAWTKEAADFLAPRYQKGTGILIPFGDIAGIFRLAGIPLRDALHEDIVAPWQEAVGKPALFLHEEWAITISGEKVSDAIAQALRSDSRYDCVKTIALNKGPVIQIYRRR
jgi:4-amino-4-deoxy-L-arabinose transferase-like glycosyltransferase